MPRKGKSTGSKKRAAVRRREDAPVAEAAATEAAPLAAGRVIERPDGFYWESKKGGDAHGPFPSKAEAEADLLSGGSADDEVEPTEGLQEAESELGINEWIDPDTGGPAEDNVPRIEDH